MIRNIAFGAATAVALAMTASAASAADLPAYEPAPVVAVPSFSWTGPYIGVQGGYGFGKSIGADPKGFVIGGYLGYNVQLDNSPLVLGIETDFNYADIDGTKNGTKVSSEWNGATRGRIGFAFDRFLVYGAGGLAYSQRELKRAGKDSKGDLGYTVGAGVEYAATDEVSVRAEYRYSDYGTETFRLNARSPKADYDDQRVMVGVAYKFASPF